MAQMESALAAHDHIDLVYAHNDPMAIGAYLAAKAKGREKRDEVRRHRRAARDSTAAARPSPTASSR